MFFTFIIIIMLPCIKTKKRAHRLNIMVAGRSKTGKTTFVRMLCAYLKPYRMISDSNIAENDFQQQPTREIYTISMRMKREEDGERMTVSITDTPGLADDLTLERRMSYLSKYIDHQFELTMAEEAKVKRDPGNSPIFHACLYFIDGSNDGWRIDQRVLGMLSARVNVIPVINNKHADQQRWINAIFRTWRIPVYGFVDVADVDPTACGIPQMIRVLQQDEDEDEDTQWLMMEYLKQTPVWMVHTSSGDGIQELASMLVFDHCELLHATTLDKFYEPYRTEQLLDRLASRLIEIQVHDNI